MWERRPRRDVVERTYFRAGDGAPTVLTVAVPVANNIY